MHWNEFCNAIMAPLSSNDNFFRKVFEASDNYNSWPIALLGKHAERTWLSLIKTSVLYEWARPSDVPKAKQVARPYDASEVDGLRFGAAGFREIEFDDKCQPLLQLLLERHLLHLHTRIDPRPLQDYWSWLLSRYRIEKQAGRAGWLTLPETLDPALGVLEQERLFSEKLLSVSKNLEAKHGSEWIAESLQQIAASRCTPINEKAPRAHARVVLGLCGSNATSALRSGLLMAFRLEGECAAGNEELQNHELFDEIFRTSCKQARTSLHQQLFRALSHDWNNCLGIADTSQPIFSDGSGAMAIRLAQYLALGGKGKDKQWVVPAWAVVSAAYDYRQDGWEPVELLKNKAEVLIEEGVRVLLTPMPANMKQNGTAADFVRSHRNARIRDAAPHLLVPHIASNSKSTVTHVSLANFLGEKGWRFELNSDRAGTVDRHFSLLPLISHTHLKRHEAVVRGFDYSSDYVEPKYLTQKLLAAIDQLDANNWGGGGYVLFDGPTGLGKSTLMRAPAPKWERGFGLVLGYSILPGSLEHPLRFLKHLARQAEKELGVDLAFDEGALNSGSLIAARREVGRVLQALLGTSEARLEGEGRVRRLVLAIDGVNYLGSELVDAGILSILPTPSELPEGCYVLLSTTTEARAITKRRIEEAIPELSTNEGRRRFHECVFSPQDKVANRLHLADYLQNRLDGSPDKDIIDQMIAASKERLLYASLLADVAIWRGLESGVEGVLSPSTDIWAIYLKQLADVNVSRLEAEPYKSCPASERFANWHRRILCLLAAAQEPVPITHLLAWLERELDENDSREQLRLAIEEMRKLIRIDQQPEDGAQLFSLGHDEFRKWISSAGNEDWSNGVREAHGAIVRLSQGVDSATNNEATPHETYYYMHGPWHLMEIDRWTEAGRLLSQFNPHGTARSNSTALDDLRLPLYKLRLRQLLRFVAGITPDRLDSDLAQAVVLVLLDTAVGIDEMTILSLQSGMIENAKEIKRTIVEISLNAIESLLNSNATIEIAMLHAFLTFFSGYESPSLEFIYDGRLDAMASDNRETPLQPPKPLGENYFTRVMTLCSTTIRDLMDDNNTRLLAFILPRIASLLNVKADRAMTLGSIRGMEESLQFVADSLLACAAAAQCHSSKTLDLARRLFSTDPIEKQLQFLIDIYTFQDILKNFATHGIASRAAGVAWLRLGTIALYLGQIELGMNAFLKSCEMFELAVTASEQDNDVPNYFHEDVARNHCLALRYVAVIGGRLKTPRAARRQVMSKALEIAERLPFHERISISAYSLVALALLSTDEFETKSAIHRTFMLFLEACEDISSEELDKLCMWWQRNGDAAAIVWHLNNELIKTYGLPDNKFTKDWGRIADRIGPLSQVGAQQLQSLLITVYGTDRNAHETSDYKQSGPLRTNKGKGIGRNDRCPCNSGKKFKKCCGKRS